MYLKESMSHGEQLANLVQIAHREWQLSEASGMEEYNFDDYLAFIGECAIKICSEKTEDWPL